MDKAQVLLTRGQINVIINATSLILSLDKRREIELSEHAVQSYSDVKSLFERVCYTNFTS